MNNQDIRRRRGVVLLIVLGILALLSALTVSFVQLSNLEKSISRNYVDKTRAWMVAESGVEYAISRLGDMISVEKSSTIYEDMQFNGGDYTVSLDDLNAPPSFASQSDPLISGYVGDSRGANTERFRLKVLDESGRLNLNDTNGHWNIDTDPADDEFDTEVENAPGRLEKIVEALGDNLFGPGVGNLIVLQLFSPSVPGSRPNQPGEVFASMEIVREQLVDSGALSQADFDRFRREVTLNSWQDANTLRPNFQLNITGQTLGYSFPYQGFDVYLHRDMQSNYFELEPRSPININTASYELICALIGAEDQSWGIQGWYLREGPGERVSAGRYGNYGITQLNFTDEDEIEFGGDPRLRYGWEFGKNNILGMAQHSPIIGDPFGLAKAIWSRIHDDDPATAVPGDARPFSTWEEFEYFLREEADEALFTAADGYSSNFDSVSEGRSDTLPSKYNPNNLMGSLMSSYWTHPVTGSDNFRFAMGDGSAQEQWWIDYLRNVQVDALLANFDPNTRTNEYTPNRIMERKVDKAHLTTYTSEICFYSTGVFDIESLALICDGPNPGAAIVGRAGVHASVKIFEPLRLTTQQQFMGWSTLASDSYDELSWELAYGPFAESAFSQKTAGAELISGHDGFTVQSYPEPLLIDPADLTLSKVSTFSPFDGSLMLATWQCDYPGISTFEMNYNGSLKPWPGHLNTGDGGTDLLYTYGTEQDLPTQRNLPTDNRLMNPVPDPSLAVKNYPGNLYPDGAYSETGRALSLDINNFGDEKCATGVISMWVKPQYHPGITPRVHRVATLHGTTYDSTATAGNEYNPQLSIFYFAHDINIDKYSPLDVPDSATNVNPNVIEGTNVFPLGEMSTNDAVKWGWEDESVNPPPSFVPTKADFANPGWIPMRCFAAGWGGLRNDAQGSEMFYRNMFGRWTTTANHDWPGHGSHINFPPGAMYNFEGHCWNHVSMSWDIPAFREDCDAVLTGSLLGTLKPSYGWFSQPNVAGMKDEDPGSKINPAKKMHFAVNGQWINNVDLDNPIPPALPNPNNPPEYFEANYGLHPCGGGVNLKVFAAGEVNRFMRMGEFGRSYLLNLPMNENYSADAVYDDILSLNFMAPSETIALPWAEGRYYNQDSSKAFYTSPPINVHSELNLSRFEKMRLKGVYWTGYWPKHNREGNFISANFPGVNVNPYYDTMAGDPMADKWNDGNAAGQHWDPFSVDVSIEAAGFAPQFLWTSAAPSLDLAKRAMPANASGSDIWELATNTSSATGGAYQVDLGKLNAFDGSKNFQFRVYFNYVEEKIPFYESPVLDDITFFFAPLKPTILSWAMVNSFP